MSISTVHVRFRSKVFGACRARSNDRYSSSTLAVWEHLRRRVSLSGDTLLWRCATGLSGNKFEVTDAALVLAELL